MSGLGEVEVRLGQLGRGLRPYLLFLHTDLTAQYLLNFQVLCSPLIVFFTAVMDRCDWSYSLAMSWCPSIVKTRYRTVLRYPHYPSLSYTALQVPQLLQQLQQAEAFRHPVLPRAPPPTSPVQTHTSILRAACALPGLGEVR